MGARLFTAVLPPEPLIEELDVFLGPRRDAESRMRWTRPDTWHLTTSFMADVFDRQIDRLIEALAAAASRTPAFRLSLAGGGAFPWPVEARNLWLGVDAGVRPLTELAERARNAGTTSGVRVDGKAFTPHVTLARANRPIDATRLVRVLDTFEADGWDADEFVLIESHLHDRSNRYEVLERFALASPSA